MKNYLIAMSFIIAASAVISCSKNDAGGGGGNGNDSTGLPLTTANLVGKWTPVNTITVGTTNGVVDEKDTVPGHANEYVDIRSDNKIYAYLWDNSHNEFYYDTTNFKIINANAMATWDIGDDPAEYSDTSMVKTFTKNNLTLYFKEVHRVDANTITYETWTNLKR